MNDERFYAEVVLELRLRGPVAGLWAKAYAEANGNESQAKALYLRYRVEQLAKAAHEVVIPSSQGGENSDLDNLYDEFKSKFSKYAQFLLIGIFLLLFALLTTIFE